MVGDPRWTGAFGVNVDVIARTHCSVEIIKIEDIQVHNPNIDMSTAPLRTDWWYDNRRFWRNLSSYQSNVVCSVQLRYIRNTRMVLKHLLLTAMQQNTTLPLAKSQ